MEEKQLEVIFKQFLLGKGYSPDSLLSQIAFRVGAQGVFRPDLLILDIVNKEYIAIIEFKRSGDEQEKINTLGQFYKYFSLIGSESLPAYLVFPISETDFQILFLTNENKFVPITKEEFPSFETLSAKKITEEKMNKIEIEERTLYELKSKKRRARLSAYFMLLSLIIGLLASIIAIYMQQKGALRTSQDCPPCCDSLVLQIKKINEKILKFEGKFQDTIKFNGKVDTMYVRSIEILKLEKRIKILEEGIPIESERIVTISKMKNEIEMLRQYVDFIKELNQTKIESLKEEMNIQNAWMLGVLIVIIGSIFSLVIPNILPKKDQNLNQ